jgi:hypothetical protein
MGVAYATDGDNETLQHPIEQQNENVCQVSLEHQDKLESNQEHLEKIETSNVKKTTPAKSKDKIKTNLKVYLTAPDVDMYYKDGSQFVVTLKNHNKKVMKNEKIKITVNEKTYVRKTDSQGKARLTIGLKSGTYKVKTTFTKNDYYKKSVESKITIKSTIKCSDLSKYYKNSKAYSATFLDKKGKCLRNEAVKFKINGKTYSVKTSPGGVAKLNINLNPGRFLISSMNPKTSEMVTKTVTIKPLLETKDLTMNEHDGSKFTVKVVNSNGHGLANKKVIIKVNNNNYNLKTNSNGIASKIIDLNAGKYKITTRYSSFININTITVNKVASPNSDGCHVEDNNINNNNAGGNPTNEQPVNTTSIKKTKFVHTTIIPNYVNVTIPYAFHNSDYTLKTGVNGTVKMPKIELITVEIGQKTYRFSTGKTNLADTMELDYKIHRIDGLCLVVYSNMNDFREPGVVIKKTPTYTQIEYQGITTDNIEMFGVYANKGSENTETFTYLKNDEVTARVSIQTQYYDETGVKYSLAKLYNRVNMDFNYYEITNHVSNPIVFTNTGKPVTYSYFTNYIVGYPTREDIVTRFSINGREELEKIERISYGRDDKYRSALGFEMLQSYSIINEKVTHSIMENWANKNSAYLSRFGVMNVYGMHIASLETAWLADEIADNYSKEFNVNWNRENTLTILGGINLEDTYLHILNADMGMSVTGDKKNVELFKFINSLYLPNIEQYVLEPVAQRYWDNSTNSLDNVLSSGNFSIAQLGEMMYVFNNNDSAIILNTTSGVCNVILNHNNNIYKGSQIHTSEDCCGVGIIPKDIIKGLRDLLKYTSPATYLLSDHFNKIHPLSVLAYNLGKFLLKSALSGAATAANTLVSTMVFVQATGSAARERMIDEKDWHGVMDTVTFTRPGYLQSKKVYNIPNSNGGMDYIEVKINDDLTLDRTSAKYISNGNTRQLSKDETYKYFCEDYWTPFSMPTKYWDKSWKTA